MALAMVLAPLLRPSKSQARKFSARVSGWTGVPTDITVVTGRKSGAAPTIHSDLTDVSDTIFANALAASFVAHTSDYSATVNAQCAAIGAGTLGDNVYVALVDGVAGPTSPLLALKGPFPLLA